MILSDGPTMAFWRCTRSSKRRAIGPDVDMGTSLLATRPSGDLKP